MNEHETPADIIKELAPIKLVTKRDEGRAEMLANIDDLRAKILSGEVIAWCGVGIGPDDTTWRWQASASGVTNLRVVGAVATLLYGVHAAIDES